MKESDFMSVNGVWMPASELHMLPFLNDKSKMRGGVGTYQIAKLDAAVGLCERKRVAVDVGGHVGTWSMWLAQKFERVHAFEPHPMHQECWRRNLAVASNAYLHPYALGERDGEAILSWNPESTGDTWVVPDRMAEALPPERRQTVVQMLTLDHWWRPTDLTIDFMKLDCEGYELPVLYGAAALLDACRPVICVEQKPRRAPKYGFDTTEACTWLTRRGYEFRLKMNGDYMFVHGAS